MLNKLGICACLISVLLSCAKDHKGYSEKPSGLFFKLETIEDNQRRIQKNNYLQFKYSFKDYSGKLFDESRILLKVNDVYDSGGLVEALSLVNEKEKASVIFPLSKLKQELYGAFQLNGLPDTTLLYTKILIDSIYTEEEFKKAKQNFYKWVNQAEINDFEVLKEEALMDDFEVRNHITTNKTLTGLRYLFRKRGKGEGCSFGKRVELKYTGKFLNGEIFNLTEQLPNQVQDFYIGQEMQVIKGIEEALLFMREGDILLLIIPSWIAFGEKGSSTGVVPPKTPVVYELELNKVN